MNGETLEQTATHRLVMYLDECPENPRRDYDHLSSVVTVDVREWANIDDDAGPLADAWRYYKDRHARLSDAMRVFMAYARVYHGATVIDRYPRDGSRAIWYLTREVVEGPNGTPDPVEYLWGEIAEYEAYAEGDAWGYAIEKLVTWTADDGREGHTSWEIDESCWGFFGYEYAVEAAREAWNDYVTAV